jgi:hypothetical protein
MLAVKVTAHYQVDKGNIKFKKHVLKEVFNVSDVFSYIFVPFYSPSINAALMIPKKVWLHQTFKIKKD